MGARAVGADAVLLITAILEDGELASLNDLATRLGMSVVFEVHSDAELQRELEAAADIIALNNRDLTTMETDRATTATFRPRIPAGHLVSRDSRIDKRADVKAQ